MLKKFLSLICVGLFAVSFMACELPGDGQDSSTALESSQGGQDSAGVQVARDEWDNAFDELIAATNSTLVVAGKSKLYDEANAEEQFCVQKIANGIIYQANDYDGDKEELYVTETDGVDYKYKKEDGGVWEKDEYSDQNVKYSNEQVAGTFNAFRATYDSLTYDSAKGLYYGENVNLTSQSPSGIEVSQTLKKLAIKFESKQIAYIASDGYVMRRSGDETEYTIVGDSTSLMMTTIRDVTGLTLPEVGGTASPDYSDSFETIRQRAFEIINSYFEITGGNGAGDSSEDSSSDSSADGSGDSSEAPILNSAPVSDEVMSSAIAQLTTATNVTVTSKQTNDWNEDVYESVQKFDGDKQYSLEKNIMFTGDGSSHTQTYEKYWEGLREDPSLGGYACDFSLYRNPGDAKWMSGASTKDISFTAIGVKYLQYMDQLTFDTEQCAYVGTNIVDTSAYGGTYESIYVSFVGENVYQVKVTEGSGRMKNVYEYTYTDYGTTVVTRPAEQDIYAGRTKEEFERDRERLMGAVRFSIQYTYQYQSGHTVQIREDYGSNAIMITRDGDSEHAEYYVLEDDGIYHIYVGDNEKEEYVKELVDSPETVRFPPEINEGKTVNFLDYIMNNTNYDAESNTYVGKMYELRGIYAGYFSDANEYAEDTTLFTASLLYNHDTLVEMHIQYQMPVVNGEYADENVLNASVAIKIYELSDPGDTEIWIPEVYEK